MTNPWATAHEIQAAFAKGETTAKATTEAMLDRISDHNPTLNAYTDILAERALSTATKADAKRREGSAPGPLAGVPFAVKNLFGIKGIATRAGSKINRECPPAQQDAVLIQRLERAGAILLGGLNMGEYAYDFTGRNAHDGHCRNPHDPDHMTGGSSSGSGSATAAGLAPISLGSDTNGSIRVPSSLCGIFGLKPTYGRLSRHGSFPFVDSLDHLGPFARCTQDLALAYDAMQGPPDGDHACAGRPVEPTAETLDRGIAGLRVAKLTGWFDELAGDEARAACQSVAEVLAANASLSTMKLEGAQQGRAAAYLITNAESSSLHLPQLRDRAQDYDPETRDRFLAGALLPSAWLVKAQRVRRWWLEQIINAFRVADLMIVPATPCPAPHIDQEIITLGGRDVPTRPNLGALAQPFSCVGLPIVTVPVFQKGTMPIGVQLIAPPWREDIALRAARFLESEGIAMAHPPPIN